jgi:hypothetical protein
MYPASIVIELIAQADLEIACSLHKPLGFKLLHKKLGYRNQPPGGNP